MLTVNNLAGGFAISFDRFFRIIGEMFVCTGPFQVIKFSVFSFIESFWINFDVL